MKGIYFFLFALLTGIMAGCSSSDPNALGMYFCDAENAVDCDSVVCFEGERSHFSGGDLQSKAKAYEGQFSIALPEKKKGFELKLDHVFSNQFIRAEVWRLDPESRGKLVVVNNRTGRVLKATERPYKRGKNGWELLALDLVLPPGMHDDQLSVFVFHPGTATIYFDNLKVEWKAKPEYPDFADEESLDILFPAEDLVKIKAYRDTCIKKGFTYNEARRYYDAAIRWKGTKMQVKIRLQGSLPEEMEGPKWMYKVRVKSDHNVMGMRSFYLIHPGNRSFMDEWMLHQLCKQEDVLTTRYTFVPITLNAKRMGVFALEECYEKQVVEAQNRREGPIIKFDDQGYWERRQLPAERNFEKEWIPVFDAAYIEPCKKSKTLKTDKLRAQFLIAQNLLEHLRKGQAPELSNIVDLDRLARYFAILELSGSSFPARWYNQRWYYNPVLGKLELIAGTIYDPKAAGTNLSEDLFKKQDKEDLLYRERIFSDEKFIERFNHYSKRYHSPAFLRSFLAAVQPEEERFKAMLEQEFNHVPPAFLHRLAAKKNATPFFRVASHPKPDPLFPGFAYKPLKHVALNAFFQDFDAEDSVSKLVLENFYPLAVHITGYSEKGSSVTELKDYLALPAYTGKAEAQAELKIPGKPNKVYYKIAGQNKTYSSKVIRWPRPFRWVPTHWHGAANGVGKGYCTVKNDTLYFKPGLHTMNNDLIFDDAMPVVMDSTVSLVLNRGATVVSYAPVFIRGSKKRPVEIYSTDGSGQGLSVLQAQGRSELKHVKFTGLNTMMRGAFSHTGAVTFYESDVVIDGCTFSHNSCEDALNIIRSEFYISNSTFSHTSGDALDADFCTGRLTHSYFEMTGNDAIDFSGSQVTIADCTIKYPGDKGISGGEDSRLVIRNSTVTGGVIAVASKDRSALDIKNLTLEKADIGLAAFKKKPEFGPAHIRLKGLTAVDVKQDHAIERGSFLLLDGKEITGTEDISKYRWYE